MQEQRSFDKPDAEMAPDDWNALSEEAERMYQQALQAWDEFAQEHPEITHEQWMGIVLKERAERSFSPARWWHEALKEIGTE